MPRNQSLLRVSALPALALMLFAGLSTLTASKADAANLLLGTLTRTVGEDPTVFGSDPLFMTTSSARLTDQGQVRVGMTFLDAARFPAGTLAEVRAGSISVKVPLTAFVAETFGATDNPMGATTALDFRDFGSLFAGDRVQIRIRSEFTVGGVRQRHETQWSGVMQAK